MKKIYLKTTLTLFCISLISTVFAQTSTGFWTMLSTQDVSGTKTKRTSVPGTYHLAQLNLNALKAALIHAPAINTGQTPIIMEFPNASGQFEKFAVYESSIMDPVLEAKFPMIKTYAAQGMDDPTATMRFSVTQFGLHTMVLSGQKSTTFIDPYTTDLATYIIYDRNALGADPQTFSCLTDDGVSLPSLQRTGSAGPITVQDIDDQKLRTFRLAQSCTGEYAAIFMGSGTVTQQKANVQAQMAITMNRVNGVYERDLSIHMNFIANNDLLIYLNSSTDPWSNEWNTTTAQTIDAVIGVANYDIGHNFNTTGGGNAGCIACVCLSTSQTNTHKGRGYTGSTNPTGDPFDIDYVAHEMGHQYGGYHVMNTCSRSGSGASEVEPASGSSVMGYAGICPSNIQAHSDDDFNYVNVRDISINIKSGGNITCAALTTLTNTPPTANAGADYVIPKSTAYILEGTGNDINGNASLTYNWGENDPAQSPGSAAPLSTYAVGPLYRSIPPQLSPNRYMPALATVISNTLASTWEVTPSVARVLNFSFIVRDNGVGGGQTASDLKVVTVNGTAGPFIITSQGTATTWTAATTQTVTWNVAGTTASPVSTPSVNIFFSTDGGYTYPITLATNVANNGTAVITAPSVTTTTGRIMVRGAGNIFYDINNANLTIVAGPTALPVSNFSIASVSACTSSSIALTDQSLNAPTSWTWTATSSTGVAFSNINAQNPMVTFANAGTYTISLVAKNASGSNTSTKTMTVSATPTVAVNSSTICSGNSSVLTATGASSYVWNTSASTTTISVTPAATANYTVTGTSNGCSNSKVATVTVKTTPTVSVSGAAGICTGSSAVLTAAGATTYSWNTSATTTSISVSPASTTNYTVTGTSNGCINSSVTTVTVSTTPTVAVNTSTICSGNSAVLTASGATTYSWSTSAATTTISVSPGATTSYTVTGANGSCTDTKVASVTVKITPTVSVNNPSVCNGNPAVIIASGATTYSWSTSATTSSISVSPSSTTNYTVTGTNNGCINIQIVTVTVNSTPVVSVSSTTICNGGSASLSASGAATYTWNTSATTATISVSPAATTSYTVTGANGGCTDTQVANVVVNPLPVVSLAVSATDVCLKDGPVTLTGAPSGGTYSGTAVTGSSFDPLVAGAGSFTLTYSYTDVNSCTNTNQRTVNVNLCTGINEAANANSFVVYPNPTSGNFTIDFNTADKINVEVYDAIGKLVIAKMEVINSTVIYMDQFAKGIYNVRLLSNNNSTVIRVIKN